MTSRQYIYRVTDVVKVTDGDSLWIRADVGFRQNILINVRLAGYDSPERYRGSDFEKREAIRAARVTSDWIEANTGNIWIKTEPDPDSFGRWLGDLWVESDSQPERHLGAELRRQGLASVWPRRWRDEFGDSNEK